MKFSFSVFGGMETGETGGILLDGEYYYGWTHRTASSSFLPSPSSFLASPSSFLVSPSSFLVSPSSFLALTQEKKQKKVKAPPGPGKLAGYSWGVC